MFTQEEIDNWNKIFPNCNIKQADLLNPTEPFLTKTLVAYLQMFGYDVHHKTDAESNERRLFLIKLVRHIDHILKITDKSYTFTFYDLLHPTPKKTSHMLGILLNYLYYFNMYKEEVLTKAGESLRKRDDLMKSIQKTEEENKAQRERAEKIKEEIEMFSEKLPAAKSQLAELNEIKKKQSEKIQELEAIFNDEHGKLEELNLQKRNLKKKIVSDNEAKELELQLKLLKQTTDELSVQESSTKQNLKENADNIKLMESLLKDIAEAQETLPHSQMEELKEVNKQLKNIKLTHNAKRQTKQDLELQIEKQQEEICTLQEKHEMLKNQQQLQIKEQQEKNSELENEYKAMTEKIEQLDEELHTLSCQQEEQRDISAYLRDASERLMSSYTFKK